MSLIGTIRDALTGTTAAVSVDGLNVEVKKSVLPTDAATSANQDTLISLIQTLQELNQRLAPLGGAIANTAQLRVVQTSVPSTAVTGPITSAQSIAEKNVGGVMYINRVATGNLNAINSNINNVVVT